MGQKHSDTAKGEPLSAELQNQVNEVFNIFDVDGSHAIDKQEALNHWKGAFAKISAKEFFNTVDVNHDGSISVEEWTHFWEVVKACGHTEEEISQELENIKNGESWCGFENLPKQYQHAAKND